MKTPLVPKWVPKPKPVPDDTVYIAPNGDRVKIVRNKQFPENDHREWANEITRQNNAEYQVVRISDGHALWGYKVEQLKPE